ncbi:hypothetical protein [Streptomyces sp. NPDC088789]|uniref:hypothetical protein n=1 Tax=Streptomyces sp. NPDC088789 TaxID=3365899 RepID=UPI0038189C68
MSTRDAALTVAAVLVVCLPALIWQIRRAACAGSERARIIREARRRTRPLLGLYSDTVHDLGPDGLRLLEDTDAHLNAVVASNDELLRHFYPEVAEGLDRLHHIIRDTTEGDL